MIKVEENRIEINEGEEKVLGNKEKRKLARNFLALIFFIIAGFLIANFQGFTKSQKENEIVDFSGVNKICELSTLRCYYHNVAELRKEPDGIFKYGLFNYGFKKLWIEYTGIVEVGIDVDQVQVYEPDEKNEVYVYVPEARIITVSADSDSMSEPITDTGMFTEISTDDQNLAFVQAQNDMQEKAAADSSVLNKAKNNAKKLIEQYIINVGDQIGEVYTVKWLNEPQIIKGDMEE